MIRAISSAGLFRSYRQSIIMTTNLPSEQCAEILCNEGLTGALLDRIPSMTDSNEDRGLSWAKARTERDEQRVGLGVGSFSVMTAVAEIGDSPARYSSLTSAPFELSKSAFILSFNDAPNSLDQFNHLRSYQKNGHTTLPQHMPEGHREHAKRTPERIIHRVGKAGPSAAQATERIIAIHNFEY